MSKVRDLARELKARKSVYDTAIEEGNLGLALREREELGKLVLREMRNLLAALGMYDSPLSEPQDDEDDRIPF